MLLAPHEINEEHLLQIEAKLKVSTVRFTQSTGVCLLMVQVLIVDTMGMLSSMHQYGSIAYIGGGFGSGIHNTIEASTFGLPVLFGPKYTKYQEACDLLELGGAFVINNQSDMNNSVHDLLNDEQLLSKSKQIAIDYVNNMRGATDFVVSRLF